MPEEALKNLPGLSEPDRVVRVLAISSRDEDRTQLRAIFSRSNWQIFEVRSCEEAHNFLKENAVGVLICDSELPDGCWRSLPPALDCLPRSPLLIVASSHADDSLWAESLNLGAYDVLSKPFDRVEVTRIVSLAWLYWKEQMARAPRKVSAREEGAAVPRKSSAAARAPAAP